MARQRKSTTTNKAQEETLAEETPTEETPRPVDRRAAWTPEKRRALSEKLKEYYKTHDSPMKGRKLSDETKEKIRQAALNREPRGTCAECGRNLYSDESVARGVGPSHVHDGE